ncbi:MAG: hypothetical protein H0U74_23830 [Bradymonadaceae bacterium]|nr:hypothetical protein [Lujinxingiaceae bacterium]
MAFWCSACSSPAPLEADAGVDSGPEVGAPDARQDIEEPIFCSRTLECPAQHSCLHGHCQSTQACSQEAACAGFKNIRDPRGCACVMCIEDVDCPGDVPSLCERGLCRQCVIQATREVCDGRGMKWSDGCCAECVYDGDCFGVGRQCYLGRCQDANTPRCLSLTDCPPSHVCDTGRCLPPSTEQACTRQADCPPTEACYAEGHCRLQATTCTDCPQSARCLAEPGDTLGTCAGCTETCAPQGCPPETRCFVPPDAADGFCVDTRSLADICG